MSIESPNDTPKQSRKNNSRFIKISMPGLSPPDYDAIQIPALVFVGREDPKRYQDALETVESIPQAVLIELKDGDHLALISHREVYLPLLREFFKNHAL